MDETQNMLYQMMIFTGDDFCPKQLQASRKSSEYFNTNCKFIPRCVVFLSMLIYVPQVDLGRIRHSSTDLSRHVLTH